MPNPENAVAGESDPFESMMTLTLEAIENERVRYERTKNSLLVWIALHRWFVLNRRLAQAQRASFPMPEWILCWLDIAATRMSDLADGRTYRQAPVPYGELPRTQKSLQLAKRRKHILTPDEARDQALHALGIIRVGWNAFARYNALCSQEIDQISVDLYRETHTAAHAHEMVLDDHEATAKRKGVDNKVTDARSVSRRIAKVRLAAARKPRG